MSFLLSSLPSLIFFSEVNQKIYLFRHLIWYSCFILVQDILVELFKLDGIICFQLFKNTCAQHILQCFWYLCLHFDGNVLVNETFTCCRLDLGCISYIKTVLKFLSNDIKFWVHTFLIDFENIPLVNFMLNLLNKRVHQIIPGIQIIKRYLMWFRKILQEINISLINWHLLYYLLVVLINLDQPTINLFYNWWLMLVEFRLQVFDGFVYLFFKSFLILKSCMLNLNMFLQSFNLQTQLLKLSLSIKFIRFNLNVE